MKLMTITAVFGGSFDPPHLGHFLAVAAVIALRRADRIVMVPAASHPFGKGVASFDDRLLMCRLLAEIFPPGWVEVSDIEKRKGLDGRTLTTLKAIKVEMPHEELRLLLGADILAEKDRWYHFEQVTALAPLIVVGRKGTGMRLHGEFLPPVSSISSTEVRERLRSGKDCSTFVPPVVLEYIEKRGLYRQEK